MKGARRYMLDTNAASALIRGRVGGALQSLLVERDACISVITEAELRFGVARRPEATRLAKAVEVFLLDIPILPWTSATAQAYAELRTSLETRGIGLSAMELLIATHAFVEDCILISADRAFAQVPGLRLLDWSASSVSAPVSEPPPPIRASLARAGITSSDANAATAHARTSVGRTASKKKPARKPK